MPFEIPDSWAWVKLPQIAQIELGKTLNKNTDEGEDVQYLCSINVQWEGIKLDFVKRAKFTTNEQEKYRLRKNDLLICEGGEAGRSSVWNHNDIMYYQNALHRVRFIKGINAYFFKAVFDRYSTMGLISKYCVGVTIKHLTSSALNAIFFPMPPLFEQQRIMSRVEELFDQIAAIEQNQSNIDTLYEEFKKRTLTLAIQGKLVPQDPNDEPASVLLERIRAEKKAKLGKKYVESCIYKGDDNCYYEKVGETVTNISDEMPFDLPENWAWCRLKTICSYIHRGKSPTYGTEKILPIIAQKCNQWSGIQTQKCLFADRATIKKYTEEQYLCVGDIIINSTGTGTVGRTGYVDDTLFKEYPKFVADSHVTVVRPLEYIDSKYIYSFLKSPVIQTDIEAKCSGSTNQIELATKTLQSYLIPLPPATEQYRITSRFFALDAKLKDEG